MVCWFLSLRTWKRSLSYVLFGRTATPHQHVNSHIPPKGRRLRRRRRRVRLRLQILSTEPGLPPPVPPPRDTTPPDPSSIHPPLRIPSHRRLKGPFPQVVEFKVVHVPQNLLREVRLAIPGDGALDVTPSTPCVFYVVPWPSVGQALLCWPRRPPSRDTYVEQQDGVDPKPDV